MKLWMKMLQVVAISGLALAGAAATACSDDDSDGSVTRSPVAQATIAATTPPEVSGDITVFAAASLTDAFEDIGAAFEDANPGTGVTFSFAGSPALRTQLTEGADADVYASADTNNMQLALDATLVVDTGQTFARNKLAVIVPADNPAGVTAPQDLANDGLKLVLAEAEVPVGRYAREALEKMAAEGSFGEDFTGRVSANIVSREANVKAIVTKVQLGEADAGIVYVTDVTADVASDVTLIEIPDAFNIIATYPIAITTNAGNAAVAGAFIDFVLSTEGQAILAEYGFEPIE